MSDAYLPTTVVGNIFFPRRDICLVNYAQNHLRVLFFRKVKGKVYLCTGTEAMYRPYDP